jgi:anti-sigma regulatory factor (Ser/Thr protein kinase)
MPYDGALLELDLPHRAAAPGAVRKALTSLNGSLHLVSEARLVDIQLLVGELVANAVRHGGDTGPVSVSVKASVTAMRVEVRDSGTGFDPERLAGPSSDRGGGWGLHIVDSLAHRWGVDRDEQTVVWVEIDLPQRDAPL